MSRIHTLLISTAFGAAVALASAPAQATAVITCNNATNPTTCNFGNSDPTVGIGAFTDYYHFTLAFARVLTGSFGNYYLNITQNVNFPTGGGSSTVSGGTLSTPVPFTVTQTPNPDVRSIGPVTIGAGNYTVQVNGHSQANGFYSGVLNFGAVPEPAVWGLMILGFGAVGAGLRRRKAGERSLAMG